MTDTTGHEHLLIKARPFTFAAQKSLGIGSSNNDDMIWLVIITGYSDQFAALLLSEKEITRNQKSEAIESFYAIETHDSGREDLLNRRVPRCQL